MSEVPQDKNMLALLVDEYQKAQQARIRYGNRLAAVEREDHVVTPRELAFYNDWFERHQERELDAKDAIEEEAEMYPIIEQMVEVKGVGVMLAAQVVAEIDISRDPHVSSLWKYAGYAVENGEADRHRKGVKSGFNGWLKTLVYRVVRSMMMTRSPYCKLYEPAKEKYLARGWTKGHADKAAKRIMAKTWLQHLWLVWRTLEGLDVTKPYVEEKLGHRHIHRPEDFGWPDDYLANIRYRE
jgi:hypothetical protein